MYVYVWMLLVDACFDAMLREAGAAGPEGGLCHRWARRPKAPSASKLFRLGGRCPRSV